MTKPLLLTSLLSSACVGLLLAASPAWSAVNEQAKPRNRLAAKVKPAPVAAPETEDDSPLSEEQQAVAPRVHHGDAQCEFNQKVNLTPHPDKPGRFRLQFGKMVYNMVPEPTTTGAVRLEDKKAGVVWLQIPAKSMLMNSKVGQRMVDSCVHPAQLPVANAAPVAAEGGIGIAPAAAPTAR